jgi:K+-transporting ATPase c subunit
MEQQKKEDHSSDEEVASEVIEDLFNDESFYKPEPLDTFDVYERKFDHKDGESQCSNLSPKNCIYFLHA